MPSNSTRAKRERLFHGSRPFIRPFDPQRDLWVLWAAYDLGSFPALRPGMSKEEFLQVIVRYGSSKSSCLIIEDDSRWFKERRGPVAFVGIENYGWRIEPHADFFKWAKPRTILRASVAFFQMVRYSRDVGVCVVRSLSDSVALFDHLRTYGLLFPCGKIPSGDPRGDEFLYYIEGRKESPNARTDGTRRNARDQRGRGRGPEDPGAERDRDVPGPAVLHPGREDRVRSEQAPRRIGEERQIRAPERTGAIGV